MPSYLRSEAERRSRHERSPSINSGLRPERSEGRSFATLGQNKRPCEKIAKAGPAPYTEARNPADSLLREFQFNFYIGLLKG